MVVVGGEDTGTSTHHGKWGKRKMLILRVIRVVTFPLKEWGTKEEYELRTGRHVHLHNESKLKCIRKLDPNFGI